MATVEDIWQLALPAGTELAGGQSGLHREVTWAVRLSPRPPAFAGIKGGEIALVSVSLLRILDERLTLCEVVERLCEMGVVAVAVLGPVTSEATQASDDRGIPLFALPDGSSLQELEQSVTRTIIETRTELYQRSQEIYRQLTELAIEGKGVPSIVERLGQIVGKGVVLEDDQLRVKLYSPSRRNSVTEDVVHQALAQSEGGLRRWASGLNASPSDPPVARFDVNHMGLSRLTAPILQKDGVWGYVSMLGRRPELSEADRLAVARAAAACAIELARERAVLEAQDRMQADFVDDLLVGNFPNAEAMWGRAKRLGYELRPPYVVAAIDVAQQLAKHANRSNGTGSSGGEVVVCEAFEQELARIEPRAIYSLKDATIRLVYPVTEDVEVLLLKKLAGNVRDSLTMRLGGKSSVGIGRVQAGMDGLPLTNQEARQALSIGSRLFGEGCVSYFGDLGIYRLLFAIKSEPELQTFYGETLGKLLEYDRRNRAELVKTLEAYFASCNSPSEAAQMLHTHRNTLLYRLNRIREVAGLDLDDAETRLALHLALRVGETLKYNV
ncbi:MAG: helix-turn-helix domain-containing protein [Chloroflexi bacterium]|nr:helix-turn-helix domain-containing protein [Chloroflexota bacterium]